MITKYSNISVYNTARRTFEVSNVYVKDCLFYHIGDDTIPFDISINGHGQFMIPGLIDSHMHIESSMTTPQEFSKTVLPKGTTTILADAHEVANVFGYKGLIEYMDQASYLDIFYAIPSSVPSTNTKLETTGGIVDEGVVEALCKHPKVIALGEIMNFNDVSSDEDSLTKRIISSFKKFKPGYPIEGHIPRISGLGLSKFINQGIGSDHTHQTVESLLEKTRAGLLVQLQEKSLNQEIIEAVIHYDLFNSVSLVTDDVMPDDLVEKGHLDHLIRRCVGFGMRIEDAIYLATKTPANRLMLHDRGVIAPGKLADFIILDSLNDFKIHAVYKKGTHVSMLNESSFNVKYPEHLQSIQRNVLKPYDFIVSSSKDIENVRVIHREMGSTFTDEKIIEVPVKNGVLAWLEAGLNLICVVERYGNNSELKFGFVENGFDKPCAIATSWAHDHHNILVMGNSIELIVNVVNEVIENQGGVSIQSDVDVCFIPLKYGGIVALQPMDVLSKQVKHLRHIMKECGYVSHNELMSYAVLSLLVSPKLKISDKGYVDVITQEIKGWSV